MLDTELQTIQALFSQCESKGHDPQDVLDDAVHIVSEEQSSAINPYDLEDEYDKYEAYMGVAYQEASSLNNQGIAVQVAYLTKHNAIDDTKEKLRALL